MRNPKDTNDIDITNIIEINIREGLFVGENPCPFGFSQSGGKARAPMNSVRVVALETDEQHMTIDRIDFNLVIHVLTSPRCALRIPYLDATHTE